MANSGAGTKRPFSAQDFNSMPDPKRISRHPLDRSGIPFHNMSHAAGLLDGRTRSSLPPIAFEQNFMTGSLPSLSQRHNRGARSATNGKHAHTKSTGQKTTKEKKIYSKRTRSIGRGLECQSPV